MTHRCDTLVGVTDTATTTVTGAGDPTAAGHPPSGRVPPTDHTPADGDGAPVDLLTPTQRRTLGTLRRSAEPVVFDRAEVDALIAEAHDAVNQVVGAVGDGKLVLTKHSVASVLGCERHHLAREPFEWTIRNARGSVAHRAIELTLNWRGEPEPAELVDEAIARLTNEETGLGDWLAMLSPADEADLRGGATESVIRFVESFPPLEKRWRPMVESTVRWPVAGPIQFRSKVDLVVGPPRGNESTKVLVDLKTGATAEVHRHDLRFYALLETLVRRVPPRKVASFYLDAGEAIVEDVTIPTLRSALRRTLDALDLHIELELERREPATTPGWSCRWCPVSSDCDDGQTWLTGELGNDAVS